MSIRSTQLHSSIFFELLLHRFLKVQNILICIHSLCALKVVVLCSNSQKKKIFKLRLIIEDLIPQGNRSEKVKSRQNRNL